MQVNRVQSNNYNNQPSFKKLIVTEKGAKALRKAFSPEQLEQVAKLGKELENTKHFDLRINAICDDLFYAFKHKTNPHLDSEAPLHPCTLNGNRLDAYGIDLLDCGDIFSYRNLRFSTAKEAKKAYSKLSEHLEKCYPFPNTINSFDKLKWAVDSTKILDSAAEYTGSDYIVYDSLSSSVVRKSKPIQVTETTQEVKSTKPIKPSIMQRIKNAWQALKGN